MPLATYILSLCLHIAVILLIWLWPVGSPLIDMTKPVQISLVEGDPGGNKTPSPILGPMGEKGEGEPAPSAPAEKAEVAAHEREEVKAAPDPAKALPVPLEEPKKAEPKPKPKPEPKKEVAKKPEPKKEQPKKEQPKKEQPKKEQPKKAKREQEEDPIKAALNQAKRKATSRAESGDRGSSVERALAEARKKSSGNRGGGGGEGSGPGGGGLHSVYIGQVMLAVRPNWGYASATRQNLQCTIVIDVSAQGEVQDCVVVRSSGNVQYDSSCVNAIMRTSRAGDFPPPPSPEYQSLEMVFTLNELRRG